MWRSVRAPCLRASTAPPTCLAYTFIDSFSRLTCLDDTVWGDSSYANSLALNVQITYIRKLLPDPRITITSLKKKGYILTIK